MSDGVADVSDIEPLPGPIGIVAEASPCPATAKARIKTNARRP